MDEHPQLSVATFLTIAFLPALTALVLASIVWVAGRREIAEWRLRTFRYALTASFLDVVLFLPGSIRFLVTRSAATGVWLVANWICVALLVLVLAASLVGKGWSRILLFSGGVLLFLGVFVVYARVP